MTYVFVEVPAEAVSDSLLGYKNLTNDELKVNKYTFNYWHPYATDKYIAKSSKDSTLTVNVGVSAFNVDTAKRSANKLLYMRLENLVSRLRKNIKIVSKA